MKRPINVLVITLIAVFTTLADPANILNNGGFETGLMCYQNWMWSQTGLDFKGDYKFTLSNDAHSGAHSLEIACAGNDCMKAAVYSNKIHTTPGQAYTLSLYSKCPANTNSFAYVPDADGGNAVKILACNGSWTRNELSFKTGPSAEYFFFYVFNADVSWLRIDDVVLTYADGTVPPHTVLHPGVRPVGISGQSVTVDGKPYLSLGFVNVGYDDLAAAASTGANTVNGLESYSNADCFNTGQPGYLDRAYELGLNFLPDSTTTARLGAPTVFPSVIQTFAPHLSVLGWGLADEPDLLEVAPIGIPAATLTAEYNAIKANTSLPVIFGSQRAAYDTAASVAPYVAASDIWMAEPYGSGFGSVVHSTALFNALKKKPIWLYQDAIDASLIVPKAYWAIVNGATGIHYFDWDQFKAGSGKLAAAKQAFGELGALNSTIFGPSMDSLVTATPGIGSMARYDADSNSIRILTVNPALSGPASNVPATFNVQGMTAGQPVTVLFENRTIVAQAGGFTDTFAGAARHVYSFQGATTALGARVLTRTGADSARVWQIEITNSGLAGLKNARITDLALRNISGTNCLPRVASSSGVLNLGDLAPGARSTATATISFTGCSVYSRFRVSFTVNLDGATTTYPVVIGSQAK
jgi:hypothetical protein